MNKFAHLITLGYLVPVCSTSKMTQSSAGRRNVIDRDRKQIIFLTNNFMQLRLNTIVVALNIFHREPNVNCL